MHFIVNVNIRLSILAPNTNCTRSGIVDGEHLETCRWYLLCRTRSRCCSRRRRRPPRPPLHVWVPPLHCSLALTSSYHSACLSPPLSSLTRCSDSLDTWLKFFRTPWRWILWIPTGVRRISRKLNKLSKKKWFGQINTCSVFARFSFAKLLLSMNRPIFIHTVLNYMYITILKSNINIYCRLFFKF